MTKRRKWAEQKGFSIIELLIVVGMIGVIVGIASIVMGAPMQTIRANNAMDTVVTQLRQARALAISKRRNVQVTFTMPNQITTSVLTLPGEPPIPAPPPVLLNDGAAGGLQFTLMVPPDTPMGFGNASAITYQLQSGGTPLGVMFSTSGAFVGATAPGAWYFTNNNDPANASIFIGNPGNTATARAITVMGTTGRIRAYNWDGTKWFQ